MDFYKKTFAWLIFGFQTLMILCYGLFVDYSDNFNNTTSVSETIDHYYPFYQDVHVMILIGFGFLMTFLNKYAYSALGYTLLITAMVIQASILINGFFHNCFKNEWHNLELTIESLITGDFAAAVVLISLGAVLGRLNPLQIFIMALVELIFYSINESIGVILYEAVDMGGSMYVHTFGAFFGLAVSWVITKISCRHSLRDRKANKNSNTLAMIGTLFLWMFWPSFNGALAIGYAQHRVVINTVFALSASCIGAFLMSQLVNKDNKFNMEHILNATLAGGVAVGSSADLVIAPYGALITGFVAGVISVIGYEKLTPYLEKNYDIYDTCGVNNLHGIPGIIGGLGGFISASVAKEDLYGGSVSEVFPARANGRTALEQGGYQLAALFTTIGISIISGLLTGVILSVYKLKKKEPYYTDDQHWLLDEKQEENKDIELTSQQNVDNSNIENTNQDNDLVFVDEV
ncbi:Ammonium Transporter Family [seawater metagenome]|uniref:Ammonium Transporter Family n=1 Tax=seawater metagenome TaxID=1561972 RepID=A0A5E8CL39_9ZZZZ